MITYNWNIKKMDVIPSKDGYNNFVTIIYWEYIGTNDNGISSKVEGYTQWTEVNVAEFVEYGNITLEIVETWLNDYTDTNTLQNIITKKIEDIINPPIVNLPFPWIPSPTPSCTPSPTPTITPSMIPEITTTTTSVDNPVTTTTTII